jgi:hypothetical protein
MIASRKKPREKRMNRLVALAFILGLSGVAVQAMPLAPSEAPADLVIKVAVPLKGVMVCN